MRSIVSARRAANRRRPARLTNYEPNSACSGCFGFRLHLLECTGNCTYCLVDLLLGDYQGRLHADDVPIYAPNPDQHSGSETVVANAFGFGGSRRLLLVQYKLDAGHQAKSAHLADERLLALELVQQAYEILALFQRVLTKSFF